MADPRITKKTQQDLQPNLTHSGEESLGDTPSAAAGKTHDLSFLRPAQMPDEIGRLGTYRVLKVLGEGGMGLVFQAHDPALDRLLALKVMHPKQAQNQRSKQRFLVEARAVAKVEHEHIVPIYQVAEDNGVPYIAMPFLKGETLAQRIRRQAPLPWQEAARIAREMAEGLAAAHAQGLVHRDIKPANIWLDTPANPKKPARARILDFGLARNQSEDTHITQQGAILGTPAYMSPEQAKAEDVDHRTDLFSLGSILYQMCTGKLPFPGANTFAIINALATTSPKPIREVNPQIPEGLAQVAVKLLEKNRERRPPNAEHAAQAIAMVEKNPAHSFMKKDADTAFAFEAAPRRPASRSTEAPTLIVASATPMPAPRRTPAAPARGVPMWALFAGGGVLLALLLVLVAVLALRGPATVAKGDNPKDKGGILEAPPVRPVVVPPEVKPGVAPPEQKPVAVPPELKPPVVAAPPGVEFTNSIGMKLVGISAGKFLMGSPPGEVFRMPNEIQHEVQFTKGFYIGKHEVTRGQFRKFIDETKHKTDAERSGFGHGMEKPGVPLKTLPGTTWLNTGFAQADDHPAVCVSWNDAKAFCQWLGVKEGKTYGLPTEAEWEYCCRAGTTTAFYWGNDPRDAEPYANVALGNGKFGTASVGTLRPNAWGLHDMIGNVREWVEDGDNVKYYEVSPLNDPIAPVINSGRTTRGGAFTALVGGGRCAYRWGRDARAAMADLGFRVVLREQPVKGVNPTLPEVKPPIVVVPEPKPGPLDANAFVMLVANHGDDRVLSYDGLTGKPLGAFVKPGAGKLVNPLGMTFHNGDFLVAQGDWRAKRDKLGILRFDGRTGEYRDVFVPSVGNGPNFLHGIASGPDGHLYASSRRDNCVKRYNGKTGEYMNTVMISMGSGPQDPHSLIFGPDGMLYVASSRTQQVLRCDVTQFGSTKPFLNNAEAVKTPSAIAFGPDGHLYVCSAQTTTVLRFDGRTGNFMDVFADTGAQGARAPQNLAFAPDGNVYFSAAESHNILRYDAKGRFLDEIVPARVGGLNYPAYMLFVSKKAGG